MGRKAFLRRNAAVVLAGCMTAALLGGCSDEKVNYNVGTEETGGRNTGSLKQFTDEEKWSDEWNVSLEGGETIRLSVNANVVIPETNSMSVVEVEQTVVDAEYKKHFMSVFFDNGELYYHDDAHRTKAEWEDRIAELEALIAINKDTIQGQQLESDVMSEADAFLASLEDELQECRSYQQSAPDDYVPADSFDNCNEFIGYCGEVPFTVNFAMNDDKTVSGVRVECTDGRLCVPESLRGYDGVEIFDLQRPADADANQCDMSMEEAKQLADQFIDGIGRSDQVCWQTEDAWWSAYTEHNEEAVPWIEYVEDVVCGYRFVYGTGVDGRAFAEYGGMTVFDQFKIAIDDIWGEPEEVPGGFYDSNDQISLVVTDAGVVDVAMDYPVDMTNVTGQVELLPLDSVKGIMKNEVMEHADNYDFTQSKYYNTMELMYFRLKNHEKQGSYSYVPVWSLSAKIGETRQHAVMVNAIDGSVIHIEDEL